MEDLARNELGDDYDPVTDPYTQLSYLAGRIVRLEEFLEGEVQKLSTLRAYTGQQGSEQIDVLFSAYERALDRTHTVLVSMARLDLDARIAKLHARVNQETANMLTAALMGALDAAEVTGTDREVIIREFDARLHRSDKPGEQSALPAPSA